MQHSDIQLSIGLEADDVKDSAAELREKIVEIFKNTAGDKVSTQLQQMQTQMSRTVQRVDEVTEAMQNMETLKSPAFIELEKSASEIDTALEKARNDATEIQSNMDAYVNRHGGSLDSAVPTASYEKAISTMDALAAKYAELEELQTRYDEAFANGDAEAEQMFYDTVEDMDKVVAEMNKIEQQIAILKESGLAETTVKNSEAYEKFSESLQQVQKEVENLTEAEQENLNARLQMEEAGTNVLAGSEANKYEQLTKTLNQLTNQMSVMLRRSDEMNKFVPNISSWQTLINVINQGPRAIVNMADTIVSTLPPAVQVAYAAIKKLVGVIVGAFKESWQLVSNTIKNVFTKAVNGAVSSVKQLTKALLKLTGNVMLGPLKKLADSIKDVKKQADSSVPSLKQMGRAFIQYGLGARSLYFFVRKLRSALFEGFGDLAVAYAPFNNAMSQMLTSLNYLRNSFVAAFAPIIQYVAPALTLLINKLAQTVQMIGQLIAALTGKEFVMAAPVFTDYASTTSAGAAAAKEAAAAEKEAAKQEKNRAKALKEIQRTIAGFDDVEILKEPTDTGSSTSGTSSPSTGSGTGGGGGVAFKTASIESGLQTFADMIKKAWETANFYDLGVLMSQQLGNVLRSFHENVPKIQEFLDQAAKSIASFLAGFLSVHDTFKMLGVAIADVINLIFHTLRTFIEEFMQKDGFKNLGKDIYYAIVNALANIEWKDIYAVFYELGLGIAQTLNEVLTKPDFWELVFQTLCNIIKALLFRFYAFVLKLHWGDIGTAIGSGILYAIDNFPYATLAQAAAKFISGVLTALGNMARKVESEGGWYRLGQNIANSIMLFFSGVFTRENGQSLGVFVNGIFTTLDAIINSTEFDQLAQDIIDFIAGFFSEFDWEEHADSLLHVINTLLSSFIKFTKSEKWEEIVGEVWKYISTSPEVKQFLENMWETIVFIAKTKLKGKLASFAYLGGMAAFGVLKGFVLKPVETANWVRDNILKPIWDGICEKFIINSPSKKMEPLGKYISAGLLEGILDGLKDVGTWINQNVFNPVKGGLESAFGVVGGVASKIKSIGESVVNGLKSGTQSKKRELDTEVKTINTDTQTTLRSGDWQGIGSNAINSMRSGISSVKDRIHAISQTINQSMYNTLQSGNWSKIGSSLMNQLHSGLNSARSWVVSTARGIQYDIYSTLNGGNWYDIGDNIIDGIANGIKGGWNWLYNTVWNLAVDLFNAAKRALGIASPSKVFAEKVGEMIPAGIGVGITDNESAATDAVSTMADNLVNGAKNIKLPPIAMGNVIPYNTAIQNDSGVTLKSLLDVLQSLEDSAVTREELREIITDIVKTYMNFSFYIGDEKLARHSNRGNSLIDRRYNTVKA